MRIASVLGFMFFVSSGRAQIESLLGLDLTNFLENAETIEKGFGKPLTKKLIQIANEAVAGTLTPRHALTFLEDLTSEEIDGAVKGIIALVHNLDKIVSAPGTEDQLRLGLELAPFILRQVINSMPTPTEKTEELGEKKKVENVVVKLSQNDSEMDETEEQNMDTNEIRGVLGDLMGTGKVADNLLEVMNHLLDLADEYVDDTVEESLALDNEATSKVSDEGKLEASVDEVVPAAGGEKFGEQDIKEEAGKKGNSTNEENKKDEL